MMTKLRKMLRTLQERLHKRFRRQNWDDLAPDEQDTLGILRGLPSGKQDLIFKVIDALHPSHPPLTDTEIARLINRARFYGVTGPLLEQLQLRLAEESKDSAEGGAPNCTGRIGEP